MNSIYIISPIVGAIIGYFTNWVAIKMLFRPYKKLKIGPIPIPFTPGLIPKERDRIARSIADSVGDNLLNPEFLAEEAVAPDKVLAIEKFLTKKRDELRENNDTVGDLARKIFTEDIELKKRQLSDFLGGKLTDRCFLDKHLGEIIEQMLADFYDTILNDSPIMLQLKSSLLEAIVKEERPLLSFLSADILEHIPELSDRIAQLIIAEASHFVTRPQTEELIKKQIDLYLKKRTFRSFMGLFVDTTAIAREVSNAILGFLAESENKEYLKKVIENKVGEFLQKNPQEIVALLGEERVTVGIDASVELLLNGIAKQHVLTKDLILTLVSSKKATQNLERVIFNLLCQLEKVQISNIFNVVDEKNWQKIIDKVVRIYQIKGPAFLTTVFMEFNLTQVIEDKINSFDLHELEEMILVLAKKELVAITWLGGLLGFFMGLVTPLVNALL